MKKKTLSDNIDYQVPLNKALRYLTIQPRSIKEVKDYLSKKGFGEEEIKQTIERLIDLKFLDDIEFSKSFTKSRQLKGKSKRFVSFELAKKGVSKQLSEKSLELAEDDLKVAINYIEKRLHQFDRLDKQTQKRRIVGRLQSRGFNWDTIKQVVKKLEI